MGFVWFTAATVKNTQQSKLVVGTFVGVVVVATRSVVVAAAIAASIVATAMSVVIDTAGVLQAFANTL